jgi:hypothetical protein
MSLIKRNTTKNAFGIKKVGLKAFVKRPLAAMKLRAREKARYKMLEKMANERYRVEDAEKRIDALNVRIYSANRRRKTTPNISPNDIRIEKMIARDAQRIRRTLKAHVALNKRKV